MDYEINYDTQTLLPVDDKRSKVIENGTQYIIDSDVFSIIENSCAFFGSSYNGRKLGTKSLLGITHKAPIIVEESRKIIFFPTKSPDRKDCIWINLEHVNNYFSINNKKSAVIFKNGDRLEFDISYGSLTNQILRATRLKYKLEERISNLKKV